MTQSDGETQTAATEDSLQSCVPDPAVEIRTATDIDKTEKLLVPFQDKVTASGHHHHPDVEEVDRLSSSDDVEIWSPKSEENEVISISESDPSEENNNNCQEVERRDCMVQRHNKALSILQVQLDGKVDASSEMLSSGQEKTREMSSLTLGTRPSEVVATPQQRPKTVSTPHCIKRPKELVTSEVTSKAIPRFYKEDITRGKRYSTAELEKILSPKALVIARRGHPQANLVSESRQCSFKNAFDKMKASLPAQLKYKVIKSKGIEEKQKCHHLDIDDNNNSPVKLKIPNNKERILNVSPEKRYMIEKYLQSTKNVESEEVMDVPTSDLNLSYSNSTLVTESEWLADNEESTGNSEAGDDRSNSSTLRNNVGDNKGFQEQRCILHKLNQAGKCTKSRMVGKDNSYKGNIASDARAQTKYNHQIIHNTESTKATSPTLTPSVFQKTDVGLTTIQCQNKITLTKVSDFSCHSNTERKKEARRIITTLVKPKPQNTSAECEPVVSIKSSRESKLCKPLAKKLLASPSDIFVKLKQDCDRQKSKASTRVVDPILDMFASSKHQHKDVIVTDGSKECVSKTPSQKSGVNICGRMTSCQKLVMENYCEDRSPDHQCHLRDQSDIHSISTGKKKLLGTHISTPKVCVQAPTTPSVKQLNTETSNIQNQRKCSSKSSHQSPSVIFAEIKNACLSENSKQKSVRQVNKRDNTKDSDFQSKHLASNDNLVKKNRDSIEATEPSISPTVTKPKKRLDFSTAFGSLVSSTPARGKRAPQDILNISTVSSILPVSNRKQNCEGGMGVPKSSSALLNMSKACQNSGCSQSVKEVEPSLPIKKILPERMTNVVSSLSSVKSSSQQVVQHKKRTSEDSTVRCGDSCKDTSSILNTSVAAKYGARKNSKKGKDLRHKSAFQKNICGKGSNRQKKPEECVNGVYSNNEKNIFDLSSSPEIIEDAETGKSNRQKKPEECVNGVYSNNEKNIFDLSSSPEIIEDAETGKSKCQSQHHHILFSENTNNTPEKPLCDSKTCDRPNQLKNSGKTSVMSNSKEKTAQNTKSQTPSWRETSDSKVNRTDLMKSRCVVKQTENKSPAVNNLKIRRNSTGEARSESPFGVSISRKRLYSSSSDELENSPKRFREDDCVHISLNSSSAYSICEGPGKCSKPFCFSCA